MTDETGSGQARQAQQSPSQISTYPVVTAASVACQIRRRSPPNAQHVNAMVNDLVKRRTAGRAPKFTL